MRSLILIGALCVLALTTITTIVHGANPFACNDVCVSAQQYCTAACQKESLRPVCSQACQDGYQSCLTTCTIGDAAASNAEEGVAVPMSVTSSSSIRHRIHSAKQHKKHAQPLTVVAPSTPVKKDNDDQCIQVCNTNDNNCTVRCQLSCSMFPGNGCSCANGPYSCADQQAQCIAACDE